MTVRPLIRARIALPGLLLGLSLIALTAAAPTHAQDRVAHANMKLILSLMPEMNSVMGRLDSFEKELAQQIDVKRAYMEQKYAEAQQAAASGAAEADLDRYRQELQGLDQEIQRQAADSTTRMNEKQAELLEPVIVKLQATVAAIAEREGYAYVLNSVDGVGTSIVLHGPEDRNLTRVILAELGIETPEESAEPTGTAGP